MGDFSKNPEKPFEVRVPNKIRKRIAMHEKRGSFLEKIKATPLRKVLWSPPKPEVRKRGSMWSRFTGRVKKFLR